MIHLLLIALQAATPQMQCPGSITTRHVLVNTPAGWSGNNGGGYSKLVNVIVTAGTGELVVTDQSMSLDHYSATYKLSKGNKVQCQYFGTDVTVWTVVEHSATCQLMRRKKSPPSALFYCK
ncbi:MULTISPECIES: STY0301 family protein [Dyella]|uniref:Uncharacterized protein n=2 Tax=Dyella TaxID=231454 RepID=A0A4R0YDN5_9GAMM|nr:MULTISPECIES: STY0301 family protein [Dyella]TBR36054.1 hypothetical protein EYV96_15715 [Dyella terrae]TCI06104.1 hypothetical protein EZM97_34810 [Dyella soli]